MNNHFHLVLRNRPDIVRGWSDEQIARRWLRLCPLRKTPSGDPAEPTTAELAMLLNDPMKIAQLRIRLSDISWWMRMTNQKIAQRANREDGCTGHFWEGRYRADLLLDEASILGCAMYVDLNPIRAAMAESLEDSDFTGAKARIDDLVEAQFEISPGRSTGSNGAAKKANPGRGRRRPRRTRRWERSRGRQRSGWLSPLEINEAFDPIGSDPSPCGRRASLKGFLSLSVVQYLELLDWTGRQLRGDKRGAIPPTLAPIIERLGIKPSCWLELVGQFGRLFKRAAGTQVSLDREARRRGQNWMQAPGRTCFG